jgi:hypothetical protein
MRISPSDYGDATRFAHYVVAILFAGAGALVAFSMRRITLTSWHLAAAIVTALVVCNVAAYLLQRISLPKLELRLASAIKAKNGDEFFKTIIRREMAKLYQPIGGLALTIGFLAEITVSQTWH